MSLGLLQLFLLNSFRPSVTHQPPDFFVVLKRNCIFTIYGIRLMLQLINGALSDRHSTVR